MKNFTNTLFNYPFKRNQIKKYALNSLFIFICLLNNQNLLSQCSGLQVISFKADNPDIIYLQATANIPASTVFHLTDNEWNGSDGFVDLNETERTWTSPASILPSGSIIELNGSTATCGTLSGAVLPIGDTGDEIFITSTAPATSGMASSDVCFGVIFDGTSTASLTGITGVNLGETDNGVYVSGDITMAANWTIDNNPANITFPVGSCGTATTTVEFTSTSSSIAEDGTSIDVCVSISNEDATTATTVELELAGTGNTATNGADYSSITFPVTLTFPVGSSTQQCQTFTITDDSAVEGDETIDLVLQNPLGGNSAALGTNTSHILTITDNDVVTPSGITALGTCSGINAANENNYNITISGLDASTTYDFDFDGDGTDDETGFTGATSFTTSTPIAFTDGTASQTVQIDAGADGSYETIIVVHEVLCTDADDDGDLDFGSGCDEDGAGSDRGYIVSTAAPYNGNNVYVYVLTNTSDVPLAANSSGLFTGLASGGNSGTDDYNVLAFNFASSTDATAFIDDVLDLDDMSFTTVTSSSVPTGCSMACGTMAYDIECRTDDVALTKVVNSGSSDMNLEVGDKVTFDITLLNQGTDPIFDIVVADYIPAGFDFLTADNSGNAFSGIASDVTGGNTVTTTVDGPIASNGMQLIQIVLTVNSSATNTNLTNTAEITEARETDGGIVISDEDSPLGDTTPDVANETNNEVTDAPDDNTDEDDFDFAIVTLCSNPIATVNDPEVCMGTTSETLTLSVTSGTPTMYAIDYDTDAETAGFVDVATTSTLPSTFVIPAAATAATYNGTITYTDANGCSGTDDFTITINANPVATLNDPEVCMGTTSATLTLTTTSGTPIMYAIDYDTDAEAAGFVDIATTGTLPTTFVIPAGATATTYNGTITYSDANNCSGTDDFTITVGQPVAVEAGSGGEVCSTGTIDLTSLSASISGGSTSGTWSTTTGGTFDDTDGVFGSAMTYTPSATDVAAGSVTLTLTSSDPDGPCTSEMDTVTIPISNVSCGTFPWNGGN